MKNKGLSSLVSTIVIIALAILSFLIVWYFVHYVIIYEQENKPVYIEQTICRNTSIDYDAISFYIEDMETHEVKLVEIYRTVCETVQRLQE